MVTLTELRSRGGDGSTTSSTCPPGPTRRPGGALPDGAEGTRRVAPIPSGTAACPPAPAVGAALGGLPAMRTEAVDNGVRMTSPSAGTLPLLLPGAATGDAVGRRGRRGRLVLSTSASLRPAAEDRRERQPDCGCEACDSGRRTARHRRPRRSAPSSAARSGAPGSRLARPVAPGRRSAPAGPREGIAGSRAAVMDLGRRAGFLDGARPRACHGRRRAFVRPRLALVRLHRIHTRQSH